MNFEWDENKNITNIQKHGIAFEEAQQVFENFHITEFDLRFDYGEIREITIGEIFNFLVVVVVHTDRAGIIRIISARKANKNERRKFNGARGKYF